MTRHAALWVCCDDLSCFRACVSRAVLFPGTNKTARVIMQAATMASFIVQCPAGAVPGQHVMVSHAKKQ